MARALMAHVTMGQASQLVVNKRHQPIERGLVTATPRLQQSGDFMSCRLRHQNLPPSRLFAGRPSTLEELTPTGNPNDLSWLPRVNPYRPKKSFNSVTAFRSISRVT